MASAIKENFGSGGANVPPNAGGTPTLAQALRDTADDLAELRTQFIALLAKLDTNHAAATDHESTLTPAALNLTKG